MKDELDEGKIKAAWLDEAKEFGIPSADIERVVRSMDAVYRAIQAWMAIYAEAMQAMGQAMVAFTEALNLEALQRVIKELEEAREAEREEADAAKHPAFDWVERPFPHPARICHLKPQQVPKALWHPMYGRRPK